MINPLGITTCPTRRDSRAYPKPWDGTYIARNASRNSAKNNVAGRSDYAINCGDTSNNEFGSGPASLAAADSYNWRSTRLLTGISFQRSSIRLSNIPDGSSKTYLIGEKYLTPRHYSTGLTSADNETWCTGYNNDLFRNAFYEPMQDTDQGDGSSKRFGSAHPAVWLMGFCDGSIHVINFDLDLETHRKLANRKDGLLMDEIDF